MKPEEQLENKLTEAGLSFDADLINQLIPMYQRWQGYIKEAREIEVRDQDPAHVFCPKHW